MFGDGKGNYPEGAYVNMVLMHGLNNTNEVEVLYKGLETPLDKNENFGTLVAMRDFRDGTNLTGMNMIFWMECWWPSIQCDPGGTSKESGHHCHESICRWSHVQQGFPLVEYS